jgi:hypothetical protein
MTQTEIEATPWAIAMEGQLSGVFDDTDFLEVHRRMSPFNVFEAVVRSAASCATRTS